MVGSRRFAPLVLAALALPVALAIGCSKKSSVLRPDVPPETSVFVQFTPGPEHAVNHLVHLYWSGSDPDGDVVAFEFRFVHPGDRADTVTWHRTTLTDSVFAVYTPNGVSMPTFEVRAIDNAGLTDPTPASQGFTFTNQPPTLTLAQRKLSDTTFASVTLFWSALDPDGDTGKMRFRVWLDSLGNINGYQSSAIVASRQPFTVPTYMFRQGGRLLAGYRRAYVQPIDDGGMLGAIDSTTWYVRAPVPGADHGRLLLFDDVTGFIANPSIYDSLYLNTAKRNLPPDQFSIVRLTFNKQMFLSAGDIYQTFALFDAVVWYRGSQGGISSLIQNYQSALGQYLDGGGQLMVESFNLVDAYNAPGALNNSWVTTYLNCDSLHFAPVGGEVDSTANWSVNGGDLFQAPPFPPSIAVNDTAILVQSRIITDGLRGFALRDTGDVVLWARRGYLSPPAVVDVPIAVSVPQKSGGRFVVTTFPLRNASSPAYPGMPRLLAKLFKQMGLAN